MAGTNYLIKVQVENDEFIHVKIFRPLPHTNAPPEVTDLQLGKALDDNL